MRVARPLSQLVLVCVSLFVFSLLAVAQGPVTASSMAQRNTQNILHPPAQNAPCQTMRCTSQKMRKAAATSNVRRRAAAHNIAQPTPVTVPATSNKGGAN